jgi:antirestriction protein ArdC
VNNAYEAVTNQILEALSEGVVPWRKPWSSIDGGTHRNGISNKPYRGLNPFILDIKSMRMGYSDPRWVTYKQSTTLGGKVTRGEKGTPIMFWKKLDPKASAIEEAESDGKPMPKGAMMLRVYYVFNVEQCEGLKLKPLVKAEDTFDGIAMAAAIVAGYHGPKVSHGGDRAFYAPRMDAVRLPEPSSFVSADAYYGTAFHELTHSTGHPDRLGRFDLDSTLPSFGSEDYSKEELVAEFGAAFLCNASGITSTLPQSASYIENWANVIRKDSKLIIHAAAQAQKAADLIQGVGYGTQEIKALEVAV